MRGWLIGFLILFALPLQATQDLPGAEDPLPEIRDLGQVLTWQQIGEGPQDFAVPLGSLGPMGQVSDWARLNGLTSRTYYVREGSVRRLNVVFSRQREVLERQGFEIRAAGLTEGRTGTGVGSRRWLASFLETNPLPPTGPPPPWSEGEAQGVVVGSRDTVAGEQWAITSLFQPEEGVIGMLIDVIQTERASPPEPISATALAHAIASYGHVVLDGLSFDADGTLTPGADAVLVTVARFLTRNVRQSFRIVGHTDDAGSLAQAQRASQAQAEAVIAALVADHGIPADRLRAFGIGPLSPLFPNETAAGRLRNRRVELVAGP